MYSAQAVGATPPPGLAPTHASESMELLQQLLYGAVPVVISNPEGAVISATLWGLDEQAQRINFSARDDNHQLDTLVEGDESVAAAYLDAVQIRFDLHELTLIRGVRSCTLQARLPQEIHRFQRRVSTRLLASPTDSPHAHLRHPGIPDMQLSLRMVDISLGGCALWLPHNVPPIDPGATLNEVQIELDTKTHFTAQLTLRNVASMNCSDSERGVRLGCAWRPVGGPALRKLQTWIDQSQRRARQHATA
jgi:flagellar brake protein